LKRDYLFDSAIAPPENAPFLPAPPDEAYDNSRWLALAKVLDACGDKDEFKAASETLVKHAAHPTELLFRMAEMVMEQDRKTVAQFLINCLRANTTISPVSDEAWRRAFRLAEKLTNKRFSPPQVMTDEARVRANMPIIDELDKILAPGD